MSSSTDYLSQTLTAAGVLTDKWFSESAPTDWVPNDYWRAPVICTLLADLMMLTDKVNYTTTLENARVVGEPYMTSCGFYDDLTWWGRLFMHCYEYFKSQSNSTTAQLYLADAQVVCDQLNEAWETYDTAEYCNGGVWWRRPFSPPQPPFDDPTNVFKASNSTFGFMETALALYLELGDAKYLAMGQKCWDWLVKWKFVDNDGLVWGALLPGNCVLDPNNVPVLSLQGEALAPLWMLYKATNKTEYLDAADQVAEGTMAKMVWEGTQIMEDRDDAKWAGQSDEWKRANSGDTPFKGLFATYLGEYTKNLGAVRAEQAAKYASFLRANADAVWANFPGRMISMDWHTLDQNYQPMTNADYVNASLQYSGVCALAAAALVS